MVSKHCGQSAVLPFPQRASKKTSLTDTNISPALQVDSKAAVKEDGMLVYKVNKVGRTRKQDGLFMGSGWMDGWMDG